MYMPVLTPEPIGRQPLASVPTSLTYSDELGPPWLRSHSEDVTAVTRPSGLPVPDRIDGSVSGLVPPVLPPKTRALPVCRKFRPTLAMYRSPAATFVHVTLDGSDRMCPTIAVGESNSSGPSVPFASA